MKIIKYIILEKIERYCKKNERQHSFKENHSPMTTSFILKKTIFSYILKKLFIFAAFLDLTNVFDKAHHTVVFDKLIDQYMIDCVGD